MKLSEYKQWLNSFYFIYLLQHLFCNRKYIYFFIFLSLLYNKLITCVVPVSIFRQFTMFMLENEILLFQIK